MNKQEILNSLTELEKNVIIGMFEEGFATDNPEDNFMTYGPIYGKRERGAFASLIKKGVVQMDDWGEDQPIFLTNGFTKREVLAVTKELGSEWIKRFAEEIGA